MSQFKITGHRNGVLLAIAGAMALSVVGCGEKATPTPTVVAALPAPAPEPTPEQKLAELVKKAETGVANAQVSLAKMYYAGEGVAKDMAKATELYEKAAAQGHPDAQFKLGWIFATGEGVPKDAARIVEWTQKAAAQGDARAQLVLGGMYAKGTGVKQDAATALELIQKAAAQGNAEAQYILGGEVFRSGIEGLAPKNLAKSVEWLQKAAEQGHEKAQMDLAGMYAKGEGVTKDATKAIELWEKAAALGNAATQMDVARIYEKGEGVPKNAVKAFEWGQKAAARGDAEAEAYLGRLYYYGRGTPINAMKAFELWQKAAVQGVKAAQLGISGMYRDGEGVLEDKVLAYAWLNIYQSQLADGAGDFRIFSPKNMSADQIAEAQRLSSVWKKGQVLAREEPQRSVGAGTPAAAGSLTKQGTGTAFIVSKLGQAITNNHVIDGCKEVRVEGRDGVAKVSTSDVVNDLALLQVPGAVTAAAAINSDPAKLRQGDDIVVFGFPLNAVLSSGGNLTPGIVSAVTGLGNNSNQIQITAPIQPGSSGSPVLNRKGEVVAVVSMKLSDSKMAKATGSVGQNVNFAVSGQTLKSFLDAHKVEYSTGGLMSFNKSTADLADEAKKWTTVVECWK